MASGTYAERIREARPRLSKSFQRLADYILDSYVQAALMTASELAHEVDVDAATVVRFAQTLDYAGFPELQDEVRGRVLEDLLLRPKEGAAADSVRGQADRAFKELGDAIERARQLIDPAPMEKLLQALGQAKRVFILADAEAQFVLDELQRHLQVVGILTFRLATEEAALARSLSVASEGDLLLAIDLSDDTPLISTAIAQAKTLGLRGAAIVGGASFEAARKADIVLEVQRQQQNEAMSFVLAALVHALGSALRWRYADKYREQTLKIDKVMRRLAAARPARSN
jgi:RpiR family carbohydrate utilization transcriptional regulator